MAEDNKTDALSDAQRTAVKGLFKEALGEFIEENKDKVRSTGAPVDDKKSKGSIFESLFGA